MCVWVSVWMDVYIRVCVVTCGYTYERVCMTSMPYGMCVSCVCCTRVDTCGRADPRGPNLPSPSSFHRSAQPAADREGKHLCPVPFQPLPGKRKLGTCPKALLIFKRMGDGQLPANVSCRWNSSTGERDQNKKPRPTQIVLVGGGLPLGPPPGSHSAQAVSSSS